EVIRATSLVTAHSYEEAERAYTDSALTAMAAKADDIVSGGAIGAALVDADGLGKIGEAKVWLQIAHAADKRAGMDKDREHRLAEVEGVVMGQAGDTKAAVVAHEKALALGEQMLGHDNPQLWEDEQIYGTTLTKAFE